MTYKGVNYESTGFNVYYVLRANVLSVQAQCIDCLALTVQNTNGLWSSIGFSVLSKSLGVGASCFGSSC